ncbi:MAG: substrate-binding domain-containing protein [Candidatus Acidiferrales bacterium]
MRENTKYLRSSVLLFVLALAGSLSARAQTEVTLITSGSAREVIQQIIPGFESKTGYKVKLVFGTSRDIRQQVARGDAFDVSILQEPLGEVIASGNVVVASKTPLASVAVGIAVKKGAPIPDISTPDAVRRMLLAAKSIAYPDPATGAAAGITFEDAMKKLGIMEQMRPKIRVVPTGTLALEMTARGEVEIGLTFRSEMRDPGTTIVGALSPGICAPTFLFGLLSSDAKDPAAAKALLDYLSSPAAAPAYNAANMMSAH